VGFTPRVLTGVWVGFDQPRTIMPRAYAADVAVPVWTAIMRAATEGDEPEWIPRPEGLVAAPVCRISGKLAGEGCQYVLVPDENGDVQVKSMAYTEYFIRGTAPTEPCDLHLAVGVGGHLAGAAATSELGAPALGSAPGGAVALPRPPDDTSRPAAARADAQTVPAPRAAPSGPEQRKPGFWSRLFGRGKEAEAGKGTDQKAQEGDKEKEQPARPRQ
jgi:penicillin-binding protein 1A